MDPGQPLPANKRSKWKARRMPCSSPSACGAGYPTTTSRVGLNIPEQGVRPPGRGLSKARFEALFEKILPPLHTPNPPISQPFSMTLCVPIEHLSRGRAFFS